MKKTLIFLFVFINLFIFSIAVNAGTKTCPGQGSTQYDENEACPTTDLGGMGGTKSIQGGTQTNSGTTKLTNPLTGVDSPQQLIGKIISAVLGIVGSLALIMFIYGGLTWMMAAGNAQAVDKGKSILIWATIGLAVIFCSYALVKFVLGGIGAT